MSQQLPEEWFIRDERVNAVFSWLMTVLFATVAVVSLLGGLVVHMSIAAVVVFVTVVPPISSGRWTQTISWPILVIASIPLLFGATQPTFLDDIVSSLSVAALSMLVVVALQMVTTVRMTPGFAVFFVTLTTLATTGFWAVGSAISASLFGTPFVETNEQLMIIFTASLLAGIIAAFIFRWYFRRQLSNVRANAATEEVVT